MKKHEVQEPLRIFLDPQINRIRQMIQQAGHSTERILALYQEIRESANAIVGLLDCQKKDDKHGEDQRTLTKQTLTIKLQIEEFHIRLQQLFHICDNMADASNNLYRLIEESSRYRPLYIYQQQSLSADEARQTLQFFEKIADDLHQINRKLESSVTDFSG